MAGVFGWLSHTLSPRVAYNVGFIVYWLALFIGFPIWILGPRTARLLIQGRRRAPVERLSLLLPVTGAVTTELLPSRTIDMRVALVMVAAGMINGVGEELLWRGMFLEQFSNDLLRGLLWPLVGFSVWHLAPQTILPSRLGRRRFVLGAALVGSTSAISAWRSGGLRNCLAPHIATDSCGVTAARFPLDR
jgi:membrane protease YdiL (CAAX protease family)